MPYRVCVWMLTMRLALTGGCMMATLAGCAGWGQCGLRECPADATISGEVRALFAQSAALGPPNLITIQTVRGVVYLRGLVSTPYQIAEAGSLAGGAPGVSNVQNLLSIDNAR
jgi:osmotically-inducible protein OsmY